MYCIGFFIVLILAALYLWFTSRPAAIPALQEGMTWWKMPRLNSKKSIETFTAKDTAAVMKAVAQPNMTWAVFSKQFAALNLHPYTFAALVDAAKNKTLNQVNAAYLISDDHRHH